MSKPYFEIKFSTLGQSVSEIGVILKAYPNDFSGFFFH